MNVGILIVSHNQIGQTLLETASQMLACCPLPNIKAVSINMDGDLNTARKQLSDNLSAVDNGEGVLILTDVFGATLSNIVCAIANHDNIAVVSGVNLPMLIRTFNYPHLALNSLTEKAISGGQDGIILHRHLEQCAS